MSAASAVQVEVVFLSGLISDLQDRYNLRNLVRAAARTVFDAPLLPSSVARLDWLGIDAGVATLRP